MMRGRRTTALLLLAAALALPAPVPGAEEGTEAPTPDRSPDADGVRETGNLFGGGSVPPNTERLLPEGGLTVWGVGPETFQADGELPVTVRERIIDETHGESRPDPVPQVTFEGGEPRISGDKVRTLRGVLDELDEHDDVRLHFIGHAAGPRPDTGLGPADIVGESRARAAIVAEAFREALDLPHGAVSYEGCGASEPVASNRTEQGRLLNNRVEVEVRYRVTEQVRKRQKVEMPPPAVNRIRVCRVEEVCVIRRHTERSEPVQIRNVIDPVHFGTHGPELDEAMIERLREAFEPYRDRPNARIRFVGYSDDRPLPAKLKPIYGGKTGLTRARARQVAMAFRDALELPDDAVEYVGRGSARPAAPNDTVRGRMLNRRVEVEIWYNEGDAPAEEELTSCPTAFADYVTRQYLPEGRPPVPPVRWRDGEPRYPEGFLEAIQSTLAEVGDKTNVRLRFVGETEPEPLSRRAAAIYGSNRGLAEARAKKVMERVRDELDMPPGRLEHVGRAVTGRQFDDLGVTPELETDGRVEVVDAIDGQVAVQVLYDVPADPDAAQRVRRVEREIEPKNPYELAPLRITVDGEDVEQGLPHTADVQRCTDVALAEADIQLRYDRQRRDPSLNVTAWPRHVARRDDPATGGGENRVRFRAYSNYRGFIEHAEVRIYPVGASLRSEPLAVVPLDQRFTGVWEAGPETPDRLKFLLRVYDRRNRFDETEPRRLWVSDRVADPAVTSGEAPAAALWEGYGRNDLGVRDIPLTGGTVTVNGSGVPEDHTVWVMGSYAPTDGKGRFAAEQIVPPGLHTAEVAVLDRGGDGAVYLRDLQFEESDWYYVGFANLTLGRDSTEGPAQLVTGDQTHYDSGFFADGQLAFYTTGTTSGGYEITASADTREEPLDELFTNFADKDPDSLFRRMDPDLHYPTYGDDSTTVEDAPTRGKFYLRADKGESFAMWGSHETELLDNELAQIDRGLYGAYGHYEDDNPTTFGARRTEVDLFGAEPGTIAARQEFRGTGGSVFFLQHQDITRGSERIRVEVRDRESGLVLSSNNLVAGRDYEIDPIQGRVILFEPLPSTADDSQLVRGSGLSGNPVFLVVRYEFTPGFEQLDTLAVGGRVSRWLGDSVKIGLTGSEQENVGEEQTLRGVDLTLRQSAGTWLKVEGARTEGPGPDTSTSADGGFRFDSVSSGADPDAPASAMRVEGAMDFADVLGLSGGRASFYAQDREEGFSAPGQITSRDTTQYGGSVGLPVGESTRVDTKVDVREEKQGLQTEAVDVDIGHRLTERWRVTGAIRHDTRKDRSPSVPATQEEGERTDVAAEARYQSPGRWSAFGFLQGTARATGDRRDNNRVGAGGSYQLTDALNVEGELSTGDLGVGARLATDYLLSDSTTVYMDYSLENERDTAGVYGREGRLTTGFRSRFTDTVSVYGEERLTHGDVPSGLTHAYGVDLAPTDAWSVGVAMEMGTLEDHRTGAETERTALSLSSGYRTDRIKAAGALEWRSDETETNVRDTWLLKSSLQYKLDPSWRAVGKLNVSQSESSQGEFFDGEFVEAVMGYAYRPVDNDRWNTLAKYTYFFNLPAPEQQTVTGTRTEFVQRSHIFSVDALYDLTEKWTVGAKYAYRLGELSLSREDPEFFRSRAQLLVLRADWHVVHRWDLLVEGRALDLVDAQDTRSGFLTGVFYHVGNNVKIGAGYNFTDFSDDLTNLSFTSHGPFVTVTGKF